MHSQAAQGWAWQTILELDPWLMDWSNRSGPMAAGTVTRDRKQTIHPSMKASSHYGASPNTPRRRARRMDSGRALIEHASSFSSTNYFDLAATAASSKKNG